MTDQELKDLVASLTIDRKELDRQIKNLQAEQEKTDRQMKETDRKLKNLGINLSGISDSNGAFAEEIFYNSLEENMNFANVHFDSISKLFGGQIKTPDGTIIRDQFDIVMINDTSIALIEIKYKAQSDYPKKMVEKKIRNFKLLFPMYEKYNVYLGLGSLSFDDFVVKNAKELGVGLLKQSGNIIEYSTDWVRAY